MRVYLWDTVLTWVVNGEWTKGQFPDGSFIEEEEEEVETK